MVEKMKTNVCAPINLKVGNYDVFCLQDSHFAVDGGAMFHVVPKILWEKKIAPDKDNRIFLGLNCLLLKGEGRTILFDTGIGNKLSEKLRNIYKIDPDTTLMNSFKTIDVSPHQIDTVILSHLHLDHTGWCTVRNENNKLVRTFPNARYIVQESEWEAAHKTNELTKGSYIPDDYDPLIDSGALTLVNGDYQVTSSIKLELTGAHSPGHQIMKISSGQDSMICPCEMIPTPYHLKPAWVSSFDIEPMRVLDIKKQIIKEASELNCLLFLSHTAVDFFGRIRAISSKDYAWEPLNRH